MNIILIGYRGTGKSVVGEILARRLGMECVGLDAKIVERVGMPIARIVEKHGWPWFRDIETQVTRSLAGRDNLIIDTGGGVIESPQNIPALEASGPIFWLKASVATIIQRIQDDDQRPALTQGSTFTQEVAEVLERRLDKYQAAAQHEIDTDDLTPDQVADRIIEIIGSHHGAR